MATNNLGSSPAAANSNQGFSNAGGVNKAGRSSSYPAVSLSSFGFPDLPSEATPAPIDEAELPSLDLSNTLADMNQWADQRISIFASLDAALSRAVVEAATALNELKQQTEADAHRTTMAIVSERERLQRQVEELRLERVRLQDQLTEGRRELEAEQARKLALVHEGEAVLETARKDRDRVQHEVNQLSHQMDEVGQQLQVFFQQRFAELWQRFSSSVSSNPAKSEGQHESTIATPSLEQVFGSNFDPVQWASPTPTTPLEPTSEVTAQPATVVDENVPPVKTAVTLQQFEDAPTPKAHIVPTKAVEPIASQPVVQVNGSASITPTDEALLTLEKVVFNQENEIELEESDFLKIFQAPSAEISPSMAAADGSTSSQPVQAALDLTRQTHARRRIQRLLSRRNLPAKIGAQPASKTESRRRRAQQDRQAYAELGAKLGLDNQAITPPPLDQMFFAEGFTPPPEISSFLLKLTAEVNIGNSPSAAYKAQESKKPGVIDAESISLEAIFTQFPTDLPAEDDPANEIWLEDAPTIGELGPDFAQHWHTQDFLDAVQPVSSTAQPAHTVEVARTVEPQLLDKSANLLEPFKGDVFNNFSAKPLSDTQPQKSGIITKLYVSNLQGLAALTIEKVLRGLPGVYQVIVTTLERGEIGMEVRHHPELRLEKVLPNLPDFKLKLTEQSENVLKFMQMR